MLQSHASSSARIQWLNRKLRETDKTVSDIDTEKDEKKLSKAAKPLKQSIVPKLVINLGTKKVVP